MPVPEVFEWEVKTLSGLKKIWYKIKKSKLFNKFRQSKLNPYHWGLEEIEAQTPKEAKEIARKKAIDAKKKKLQKIRAEYIYNKRRCSASLNCSVDEEYKRDGIVLRGKGDVSDRIPRDESGNLDLLAEDPIVISIIPIEGPALAGHVSIQYKDRVVNRLLGTVHTDPLYPKYQEYSEYYFIYPSQLHINPQKLIREIDKHNVKNIDRGYNFLTNNCARNVGKVLKKSGVRDLDFMGIDKLGLVFTNPGNNPFNNGIKAWCFKQGVQVTPEEMSQYHERHNFTDVKERREKIREIGKRYQSYKKYLSR